MISLVESIKSTWSIFDESLLSKKASQVDISDIASSDNIAAMLWPDAPKHQISDWDFKYEAPTLTCSHGFSNSCALPIFDDYTITKLKELDITNIKFGKTPRHVKVDLKCSDCGGIEFYGDSRLDNLYFNVLNNCQNLKIVGHVVTFEGTPGRPRVVQDIDISCLALNMNIDGFSSNSKITTSAQRISIGDNMYERSKPKLFSANGDPIDSKFDKQKVDLIKLLGLDIINLTNKNPEFQIWTSSRKSQYDAYLTMKRQVPKFGYDFSYELADGWYLIV